MKYVKLNNGIEMPILGLGTFRAVEDELKETLHLSEKNGYQLIDNAKVYENEKAIKAYLQETDKKREEIFITSKVWTTEFTDIEAEFKRVSNALGVDYLDLYLLHWPRSYEENLVAWKQLEKLYKDGKVRAIGVSNFQIHHLMALVSECEIMPAINQVECHPNLPQHNLQAYCNKYGIMIQSYCSFMQNEERMVELEPIAKKHGKTIYQIILKYLIDRNILVIPKATSEQHLAENIDVFDIVFDQEDLDIIKKFNKAKRYYPDPDNHKF